MEQNKRVVFEHILCPVDLTDESSEALRYAVTLASAYDSELIVCHSLESPNHSPEEEHERVRKLLHNTVLEHLRYPISPTFRFRELVLDGKPKKTLPHEVKHQKADLMVMWSRARTSAAGLLGATVEAVCRTSHCPVLVIHQNEREWVAKTANEIDLARILVAYDFSDDSDRALELGLSLAQEFQAKVDIMYVIQSANGDQRPEEQAITEQRQQAVINRLRNIIPPEAATWCEIREVVAFGKPYEEILKYAEEKEVDLICAGVHGVGCGVRTLFGSNVDRILRQAPCPVMICRPRKK